LTASISDGREMQTSSSVEKNAILSFIAASLHHKTKSLAVIAVLGSRDKKEHSANSLILRIRILLARKMKIRMTNP
jgi:hypothetical protein